MKLREFFTEEAVSLDMQADAKDDLLKELVRLLRLDPKSEGILFKTLRRRENLGSTGIGKGLAIPHCRSLVVNRLRLAYGRKPRGIDFKAIDGAPCTTSSSSWHLRWRCRTSTSQCWARSPSLERTRPSPRPCGQSRRRRNSWTCSKSERPDLSGRKLTSRHDAS